MRPKVCFPRVLGQDVEGEEPREQREQHVEEALEGSIAVARDIGPRSSQDGNGPDNTLQVPQFPFRL